MPSDWNDSREIFMEVGQLFSREDDLQDVIDIKKMSREIDVYNDNLLSETQEKIRGIIHFKPFLLI